MRRVLLVTTILAAVVILVHSQTSRKSLVSTSLESQIKSKAYVLRADEGEKLEDPKGGIIKVSPQMGSQRLSMVVQPVNIGGKIGVHMHEEDEEVFFVHKGKGTVILDDKCITVDEGSVVYIPPGTWHGFEAGDDMQLVWVISPPHFVELYRLFCKPGFETTKEEEARLKRKYGFRDKPSE